MKKFLLFLLAAFFCFESKAQTFTTIANGNYHNPANWSSNQVPNASNCTKVVIANYIYTNLNDTAYADFEIAAGGTFVITAGVKFGINLASDMANYNFTIKGTFDNNGELYVNGATIFQTGCTVYQDQPLAIWKNDGNDGTAAGSVPGTKAIWTINNNVGFGAWMFGRFFNNGTVQFLSPAYAGPTILNNSSNGFVSFTPPKFIFGGSSVPNTYAKGFEILGVLFFKDVVLDNSATTGGNNTARTLTAPQVFYYGDLNIENGILDAEGRQVFVSGSMVNNGILISDTIMGIAKISGTGIFKNSATASTHSTNNLIINNFTTCVLDVNNFKIKNLDLQGNFGFSGGGAKIILNDKNLIVTNTISEFDYRNGDNYVVADSTGKFIYSSSDGISFGKLMIPIGTKYKKTPIIMNALNQGAYTAEDFMFRAVPLDSITILDTSQAITAYEIEELTAGGNTNVVFDFLYNGIDGKDNFAPAFANLYNYNGTAWTIAGENYNYGNVDPFLMLKNKKIVPNSQRGRYVIASGTGVNIADKDFIVSSGDPMTSDWFDPLSWEGGVVPTANDKVFIKNGHFLNASSDLMNPTACKSINQAGFLNFKGGAYMELGAIGGGNDFQFNSGTINMQAGSKLIVNGELVNNGTSSFLMDNAEIVFDINSGNAATSRNEIDTTASQFLFYAFNSSLTNATGKFIIADPMPNNGLIKPYYVGSGAYPVGTCNVYIGDSINTNCTVSKFNVQLDNSYIAAQIDLIMNAGGEHKDTIMYGTNASSVYDPIYEINNVTLNAAAVVSNNPARLNRWKIYGNIISNTDFFADTLELSGYATTNITGTGKVNADNLMLKYYDANIKLPDSLYTREITNPNGKFIVLDSTIFKVLDPPNNEVANTQFVTKPTSKLILYIKTAIPATYNIGLDYYNRNPLTINGLIFHQPDYVSVYVADSVYKNGYNDTTQKEEVVNKTWYIEEEVSGGSNVSLTATWSAADELTYFDRNLCYIAHWVGTTWDYAPGNIATGSDPYSVTRMGVSSFSPFAITSNSVNLPIKWLQVNGLLNNNNQPVINFKVQEQNIASYTLQYSTDAVNFSNLQTVNSKGNGLNNYSVIHAQILNGIAYYRIKQTQNNGVVSYSQIVKLETINNATIKLQSTVINNSLTFYSNQQLQGQSYSITNAQGQLMYKGIVNNAITNINTTSYGAGSYYLHVNKQTFKFIKQ